MSLILEWDNNIYDNCPPSLLILYFSNKLVIWQNYNSDINISYVKGDPTTIEDLKTEINEIIQLENKEIRNNSKEWQEISHEVLFAQPSSQNASQTGKAIEDFLTINGNRFIIQKDDFSVEYKSGAANDKKERRKWTIF